LKANKLNGKVRVRVGLVHKIFFVNFMFSLYLFKGDEICIVFSVWFFGLLFCFVILQYYLFLLHENVSHTKGITGLMSSCEGKEGQKKLCVHVVWVGIWVRALWIT